VGKNRAMAWLRLNRGLFIASVAALVAAIPMGGYDVASSPAVAVVGRGDAERGRKLLAQYQCGSCHTIPGVPSAGGQQAPSLQSFGLRSYIAGRVVNRAELLQRWISQPQALVPGTAMPSMGVSPDDARHMAAYLLELR
jgi:cytochrome c